MSSKLKQPPLKKKKKKKKKRKGSNSPKELEKILIKMLFFQSISSPPLSDSYLIHMPV